VVIVDTGSGSGESLRRFWQTADEVLLVTTPDDVSVMDAYASIKSRLPAKNQPRLRLIVNRADSAQQAVDVHRRLDQSCRRFLEMEIVLLGHVCEDGAFAAAARMGAPLVVHTPQAAAAEDIEHLASEWMTLLGQPARAPSAVA
jgi:flagellar biosynthesis protein FlhG